MSVTGGFQEQFREKVLGVNAHVLVLKYSIDFREYRDVMKKVEGMKHVLGVAPFVINPMMVTHGPRTATGVLLKGVDPEVMPRVLDLPKHVVSGSLTGLRRADAKPPERSFDIARRDLDSPRAEHPDAGAESILAIIQREVEEEMRRRDAGSRRRRRRRRGGRRPCPACSLPRQAREPDPDRRLRKPAARRRLRPRRHRPRPVQEQGADREAPGHRRRAHARQAARRRPGRLRAGHLAADRDVVRHRALAHRRSSSGSSRSSRRGSTGGTTPSWSTPTSTRPRPSTSTATASPASR